MSAPSAERDHDGPVLALGIYWRHAFVEIQEGMGVGDVVCLELYDCIILYYCPYKQFLVPFLNEQSLF